MQNDPPDDWHRCGWGQRGRRFWRKIFIVFWQAVISARTAGIGERW